MTRDGSRVYAIATRSHSIAGFERDAETGELSVLTTFPVGTRADELGPAGMGLSPDGRHVYVAAQTSAAVAVLRRAP